MDTIFACLTPPGKAAIATLGVRGPKTWEITRQLFRPRKGRLPDRPSETRTWFGTLGTDQADEVILAVKAADPNICIELHCHGGIEVVRMIQALYSERGVTVVPWQQFYDRPADLYDQVAHAPTARTAAILFDQMNGVWERMVERGESQIAARLGELIPLGQHLVAPWKIAIAGAPNVGKSSLVNALAGFTRSIVSPTPGTTRDAVAVQLAIDGWPVELIDTAGIRNAAGDLERQGIQRAQDAARDADLRLWVLDGSVEPILPADPDQWKIVINKIDLPAGWDWQPVPQSMRVSAKTRAGLEEFCETISRLLVPCPPEPGEAVPCLPEQVAWVRAACV